MRVLVCGSRHFKDKELMEDVLKQWDIRTIIEGEARGADTLAREYAKENKIERLGFPAQWDLHGKSAGPIRNAQMLAEGQPDLVVAFIFKPAADDILYGLSDSQFNRGTKNMINQAKKAGVPVYIVEARHNEVN